MKFFDEVRTQAEDVFRFGVAQAEKLAEAKQALANSEDSFRRGALAKLTIEKRRADYKQLLQELEEETRERGEKGGEAVREAELRHLSIRLEDASPAAMLALSMIRPTEAEAVKLAAQAIHDDDYTSLRAVEGRCEAVGLSVRDMMDDALAQARGAYDAAAQYSLTFATDESGHHVASWADIYQKLLGQLEAAEETALRFEVGEGGVVDARDVVLAPREDGADDAGKAEE